MNMPVSVAAERNNPMGSGMLMSYTVIDEYSLYYVI